MAQLAAEASFSTQRIGSTRVGSQVLERPLDHDVALKSVCALDPREVDARRATGTDRFDQLVRTHAVAVERCAWIHAACPFARCSITRTISPTAAHDKFHRRARAS